MKQKKPLLSIPMIFRDDIRSIERCLKALQPLRDAVPCELIMADTGSVDGSRKVAERYADLVIDFPWVNDFAAARNAAIEHCTGEWLFTVDTDEYLDEDVSELVGFLKKRDRMGDIAYVVQRNYNTYEMDWEYSDFSALRMARASKGAHYAGAIHERWEFRTPRTRAIYNLGKTILHHDGYVKMSEAKIKRNMDLLREKIKENPDDLLTHLQLLESGGTQPDYLTLLYNAVDAVERKLPEIGRFDASIYRYAAVQAINRKLPEKEKWIARMEELFPDSLFTRIDVSYFRLLAEWMEKNYTEVIRLGEVYLKGMEDYHAGKDFESRTCSIVMTASPVQEQRVKAILAESCRVEWQTERALSLLDSLDYAHMDEEQARNAAVCLREMYVQNGIDTAQRLLTLWNGITAAEGPEAYRAKRRQGFLQAASYAFMPDYQEKKEGNSATAYRLLLPLADQCEVGRGAALLDTEDPAQLGELLSQVENWDELPIQALAHALECGAEFPLPGKPLSTEELDKLASRLAADPKAPLALACGAAGAEFGESWQDLAWIRSLVLAAVRTFDWVQNSVDLEQGMALAKAFADVERKFLPLCYTPEALQPERLFLLPSMHRFGWYCIQAFDALDAGNAMEYVRRLRAGLDSATSMKNMVEFLVKHTPALQQTPPSKELAALAEQIRTVLSRFEPDDPAVETLKASEAYQKVAGLIEGWEPPIVGGLLQ